MTYRIRYELALIACLLMIPAAAQADTAFWYKWQGAKRVVCAQVSPGHGWKQISKPYKKSDCSV